MSYSTKQEANAPEKDCSLAAVSKAFHFKHEEEMSLWLPIRYIDLSKIESPRITDGKRRLFRLKLLTKRLDISQSPRKLKLSFDLNGASIYANVMGPEIGNWEHLPTGELFCFEGISTQLGESYYIKGIELVDENLGAIIPVYKGKHKYKSNEIRKAITELSFSELEYVSSQIYVSLFGNAEVNQAWERGIIKVIRAVHFPSCMGEAEFGIKKIKDLSVRYLVEKAQETTRTTATYSSVAIDGVYLSSLEKRLKFSLTGCQVRSIGEIKDGLTNKKRMLRLLNGDVGTGKTETYLLPCIAAFMGGAKLGIMVPNEILARSIVDKIRAIEPRANVKLVTGNDDDGMYHGKILVGTTAMVHRAKKYRLQFDIAVIDEEQKFSVEQKSALVQDNTNVIYSTATCIPRTGALLQYGNVDISILRECPVEKRIISRIIGEFEYRKFFSYLKKFTDAGKQVGVVFVQLDKEGKGKKNSESGADEKPKKGKKARSLDEHISAFQEEFGSDLAILHGRLKTDEKVEVIDGMMTGKFKVLICSSIIETGITLPDLFSLSVFEADHLGLSQLHQLRGRIARAGGVGDFNMIPSENCSEQGMSKLHVIREENDGFVVAEKDLELRGFGDLSLESESQTGESNGLFYCLPIMPRDVSEYIAKQQL
ncbi:MAG: helicase-related protein [Methylophilus sp.]|uniref:helicase-related protein n=1 Tax=Methylophilus sp. TaxID=29541 RepID=UPI003FA17E2D